MNYVTSEFLSKIDACAPVRKIVEEKYGGRAAVLDLINDPDIAITHLQWGQDYVSYDAEEEAAFNKRLQIIDSTDIRGSSKITESHNIYDSVNIKKSNEIKSSIAISNSYRVVYGKHITGSAIVDTSEFVTDSIGVVRGRHISNSYQVYNSNTVDSSTYILNSREVHSCFYLNFCDTIDSSAFCMGCNNLNTSIACWNISQKEYHIFNKPVMPATYNMVWRELNELMEEYPIRRIKSADGSYQQWVLLSEDSYKAPAEYYDFFSSLPNFDENIYKQILL